MEEALNAASREGNVDALYDLIKEAPEILSSINEVGYADTPLHEAARAGQTEFAIELMTLMPSFAKKLNPQGLSPLHLAVMSEADEPEERARKNKTATALIKLDAELVRVKGRARMTPLHHAVVENNLALLAEFLCACPKSINDLTNKNQSAVHIAVQERKSDALDVLLGWLSRRNKEGVLRFKDNDRNTALHIAVETEQFEVVKKLISKVNRNSLNSKGLTAWDIAERKENGEDIKEFLKRRGGRSAKLLPKKEPLHKFLQSKQGPFEKPIGYLIYVDKEMSLDMRNVILVVAVLIITATFQGVLQPPGGFWQGNGETSQKVSTFNRSQNRAKFDIPHNFRKQHNNATQVVGKVIMSPSNFRDFMGGNTVAFVFATVVIFLVLPARPYTYSLHISLLFLTYTYLTAIDIIGAQSLITKSFIIVTWLFICGVLVLRFYMHIAKSIFNDAWWLPRLYVLATNSFYQIPKNPVAESLNRFANRLMMHHKVSRLETEEVD